MISARYLCVYGFVGWLILASQPPSLHAQVNVGANFQTGSMSSGPFLATPPDTTGEIGPNHWVQFNNNSFTVFRKDGSTAAAVISPDTFWFNAGVSASLSSSNSDPRLQFDPISGRWFAVQITTAQATNNTIMIARSNDSNPLNGFKAVTITTSNSLFADYPTLGIDKNGVYIGTNNFTSGGGFSNVGMYSIPKADLLLTTPTAANASSFPNINPNTSVGFTPQVVTNYNLGQTTSTTATVFAVNNTSFSQINVTPMTNTSTASATLGARTIINVASTSNPPAARQPNAANTAVSTITLDSLDDRFGSTVYRVGNLAYSVHGISQSSRAALRVTVIDLSTNTVRAETTLGEANFDYYAGSISANSRGDVVVGYTRSGFIASGNASNRNPSATVSVGTLSGNTLTLGTQVETRRGLAEYIAPSFDNDSPTLKRWGDYSATRLDPTDPGIFWSTQEFSSGAAGTQSTEWATQVSEIVPTVAGEKRWSSINATTPGGITGNFSTATNWYNGTAPTSTDHVIFSRNGDGTTAYTVTMPSATTTTNDRASVRQGVVNFSLPSGATYNLTNSTESTPSLAVAEYQGTASLTVSGGGALQTVTTTVAAGINSEGTTNSSVGTLSINGAGTTWTNSGNVYIGGSDTVSGGKGTLNVNGNAAATINGTLTLWNTASAVNVGSATQTGGTLTTGQLTNAVGSTPTVSLFGASNQLTVNGSGSSTFSGQITGAGSLTRSGTGTLTLTGANTYTGGTTISGGTLRLGAANVLASTGAVALSGGTLSTGATTGNSNSLGALSLTASSTLELGTGSHTLSFSDVVVNPNGTLTIQGWTGTAGASGTSGRILFTGSTLTAAYTSFLTHVQFSGFNLGDAQFIGSSGAFELVPLTPVPEPTFVIAASFASLGLVGLVRRRNRAHVAA